jgi:hypothetical protein
VLHPLIHGGFGLHCSSPMRAASDPEWFATWSFLPVAGDYIPRAPVAPIRASPTAARPRWERVSMIARQRILNGRSVVTWFSVKNGSLSRR